MTSFPGRALAAALVLTLVGAAVPAAARPPVDTTVPVPSRHAPGAEDPGTSVPGTEGAGTEQSGTEESGADGPRRTGATDRVVVKFTDGAEAAPRTRERVYAEAAEQALPRGAAAGGSGRAAPRLDEVSETVDSARVVAADGLLDARQLETLTAALEEDPAVEYAEPDHLAGIAAVPDDPYYATSQWNLRPAAAGLDLPAAWDRATGAGQTIAVVDTGITPHPDLDANVLPGHDFVSLHAGGVQPGHSRDGDGWDPDPQDEGDYAGLDECWSGSAARTSSWHGTHTAGIAAARGNNATGVAGVAYDAKLLPVRALGACGDGYISDIAVAIAWAAGHDVEGVPANPHPATVVNLSLGFRSSTCPAVLQEGIDRALARGTSVVVAAGNNARDAREESPANCRGVITVAATTAHGARAGYSNWGRVTLAAPGGDPSRQILSTANAGSARPGSGSYSYKYGTSMASPTVAGIVALVRETDPSLSPAQVKDVLAATARPLPGPCPGGCGAGLVHPRAAVARATLQEGYTVQGAIGWLHARIGSSTGAPRSHERCGLAQEGCYQEFEHGAIYWSPDSGARWVHGGVRSAWHRAGGVNGVLGYPRSGERSNGAGGVQQLFQGGTVVWSAGTGGAAVRGAIGRRWTALGAETGLLGYPLGRERGGLGGAGQEFERGRILWSPATGAQPVRGAIGRAHADLRGEQGRLGYPVTPEHRAGDSVVQHFQGGTIRYRHGGITISSR
ncbi:S8 family serine peptidase [Kocuria sp. CPCC 205292]|uniref:S8 family serine peptidase n=1 Tax=Kocuria cellulosilytica TaxID=3071451 RepID=UPI0034D4896F